MRTLLNKIIFYLKSKLTTLIYFLIINISKYSSRNKIKILNEVLPFQPSLPRNIDDIKEGLRNNFNKKNTFKSKYIFLLESYYVSYYGVVFKNFRLFIPSLVHPKWNVQVISSLRTNIVSFLLQQWRSNVIKIDNDEQNPVAIVYELWSASNYYHWICDSLPRLLLLKKRYQSCTILLPSPVPEYVKLTVSWFGFDNVVEINKECIYSIKFIVIPELTAGVAAQNELMMKQVRSLLMDKYNTTRCMELVLTQQKSRFYSSRKSAKFRKITNESEVIKLLQKYDFSVIDFDEYSFLGQIQIMSKADFLIGVHGANLTNMMFMKDEAKIIEIMNQEFFNPCYYHLSSSLNMEYNYLAGQPNNKGIDDNNDNLFVELSILEELVIKNTQQLKLEI